METLKNNSENYDAIILSDYLKGVLNDELTQKIIQYFKNKNIIILVDPKGNNYKKYRGATTVKPKLKEFKQATQKDGIKFRKS